MHAGVEILASLAILANAVVYGTDVFGALVLCPANQILVTRTVVDLTIGSRVECEPHSIAADLKGFDRDFALFSVR